MGSSENAEKTHCFILHSNLSETSRNGIIKSLTSPEKVRGTMQKRTTLNKVVPQWAIHRVQLVQIKSNNSNFTMVD